jgi:hypothetical protein
MAKSVPTPAESKKYVYSFGAGRAEGDGERTTEVCAHFYANKSSYPNGLRDEVERHLAAVEAILRRKFGGVANPLEARGRAIVRTNGRKKTAA